MDKRGLLGLMFVAAAIPVATEALAQFGGSRQGKRGGDRTGKDKGAGDRPQANPLEVTLHEFHEDLKLGPGQEAAWDSYAEKLRALADDVARERSQRRPAPANLLQRIDGIVDRARNRLAALEDIAQAAKTLHAGLSPEQQAMADPRLANLISLPLAASVPGGAERGERKKD